MTRIYVVVEGQTEEAFIKDVLFAELLSLQIYLFPVSLRGNVKYARFKTNVLNLLKQHPDAYCSTFVDFYGLGKGFPGSHVPSNVSPQQRVENIESAIAAEMVAALPTLRTDLRFRPYIQLHEYEALLFSDPEAFAAGIGQPSLAKSLAKIRAGFASPEDINDKRETAPSKRIRAVYSGYSKVVDGTLGAQSVSITRMRAECPRFHEWIKWLESTPKA